MYEIHFWPRLDLPRISLGELGTSQSAEERNTTSTFPHPLDACGVLSRHLPRMLGLEGLAPSFKGRWN